MTPTTQLDLDAFLDQVTERVDGALRSWLPDEGRGDLAAAMTHIVFSGGKRLRPALVELGCLDVGGSPRLALAPAVAVELVHAYSLVHDDLPCMDDAELRRGKPCVHVVWNEAMGVLSGDALLTLAFEVLAQHAEPGLPVGRLVAVLAHGAGWEGMVGGQVDDLAAEGCAPDVERVRAIHLGKTAALLSASLQLGAIAGGGEPERVERLAVVGRELGLAFQIVDDLLDVEGSTSELGKRAGADADGEKATWPAVVGLERARTDAEEAVARAVAAGAGGRAEGLLVALGERILRRRN